MSENRRFRVMVVDDHPLLRDGLRQVLENTGEFEVVGQASDGEKAISLADELRPDVVVMDLLMPGGDGVATCREIMESLPDTRVLMLTASTEDDSVIRSVAAGATGYVVKDTSLPDLLDAVKDVAQGRVRIPISVLRRACAVADGQSKPPREGNSHVLTEREREVLAMFARGSTYADIAETQGNSPSTVRNTIYRIQDKLGTGSRHGLVAWAVRNGFLDDD